MSRTSQQCPRSSQTARECNCTYAGCPRHGLCCECLRYHRQRMELPACYFTPEEEKTFNRSLAFFFDRRFR